MFITNIGSSCSQCAYFQVGAVLNVMSVIRELNQLNEVDSLVKQLDPDCDDACVIVVENICEWNDNL